MFNNRLLIPIFCVSLVVGCGGGGGSDNTVAPAKPATYSATVTGIDIVRTADKQPVAVTSLPAQSAVITVSP